MERETDKLLIAGGQNQILFSFYYLTDFELTFADKTEHILKHIFTWNMLTVLTLSCPYYYYYFST